MLNCRRPIFGPLYLFILFIYPRRAVSFAFWAGPAINKQIRVREFQIYEHCIALWDMLLSCLQNGHLVTSVKFFNNMVAVKIFPSLPSLQGSLEQVFSKQSAMLHFLGKFFAILLYTYFYIGDCISWYDHIYFWRTSPLGQTKLCIYF